MDPVVARRTWRTLEPVHGLVYFAPEATDAYRQAGLTDDAAGYFASRAAPMGPASAESVIATFYNFCPTVVHAALPGAWTSVTPAQMLDARITAARAALHRILGPMASDPTVTEAAALARTAAVAATERLEGRPLFAAHAGLDWPDEPLMVLWHAQTLLREFRGDGHIAALVADGVSGIEALIMHGASGEISPAILKATRQWANDDWSDAEAGLVDRGWLTADSELTDEGRRHRQWVEDRTDLLAVGPYETLGDDDCGRLRALVRPLSRAVVESGGIGR